MAAVDMVPPKGKADVLQMSPKIHNDSQDTLVRNVEIHLTPGKKIAIHSILLVCCSKYFASSLNPTWAGRNGSCSPNDIPTVYELNLKEDPADDFLIPHRSPGTTDHSEGTPINEFTRDEAYYRALENLFDIFRHRTPVLHELRDISALVRLADKYDSLPSVSRAVRLHLMEYYGNTSELYRRIAREPVEYLCIGEKVRSSIITKEAAIHVIGTWSETETLCRERISSQLFDSLVRIHRQLCQKKERANKMLLSLNYDPPIPLHLDPMSEAVASLIMVRENICNAFYNCLRQNTPERFEGELYRKIAGSTIISKPQLSSARRATSQISFEEGCARLKRKIDDALSDLADNYSRVNPTDVNARYLLCARLDDAGLSWDGEWE